MNRNVWTWAAGAAAMLLLATVFVGCHALATHPAQTPVEMEKIALWPEGAPLALDDRPVDQPWMAVYRPAPGHESGTAVVVCPGGGFNILAASLEGLQVGRYMADHGLTAFVLMYRVKSGGYSSQVSVMDGQRAMRVVRAHAAEYGVDPGRIGMMGFSAGGSLSWQVAQGADAGQPDAADPVERVSNRPDFVGLIYGASGGGRGAGDTVTPAPTTYPPAFIAVTAADSTVGAEGAVRIFRSLRASGIEAELHIYGGFGPHGQGLGTGAAPGYGEWPGCMIDWLRRTGMLTAARRVPLRATVTLDGKPMVNGWLTLTPMNSEFAPVAAVLFADGKASLPAWGGPVPGRHRVEVRQEALTSIRKPEIDRDIVWTRESPGARAPMTMTVTADTTNTLTLDLRSH